MEFTLKQGGGSVWAASTSPLLCFARTCLVAQMIKNLSAMQETQVPLPNLHSELQDLPLPDCSLKLDGP